MNSDAKIREEVTEEIRNDPKLADIASGIDVAVKDGIVILSGKVKIYTQKVAAEKAVQRVRGVKVVTVDIEVEGDPGTVGAVSDIHISEAIRNALTSHSEINQDFITQSVEHGVVSLDGTVAWDYERKAAQKAIENIIGIKKVINNIKIKNIKVDPTEIKKKITATFQRQASLDSGHIKIEVDGDLVTLKGKVRSWAERLDAEDAAWSIPGVGEVRNYLIIDTKIYEED